MPAHLKDATIPRLLVRYGEVYNVSSAQAYKVGKAVAEPRPGRKIHVALRIMVWTITKGQLPLYRPGSAPDKKRFDRV